MTEQVIEGYAADADLLIPRYEAIDCRDLYAPVSNYLDKMPGSLLDIGAGTGRDAAWFAEMGYHVTAVEPVAAFREVGQQLHSGLSICWLDDSLPDLEKLRAQHQKYNVVLISGVWQHLTDIQRSDALGHLSRLLKPDGVFILSLRHGPGAAGRPVTPCVPEDVIRTAATTGLHLCHYQKTGSTQAQNIKLGVTWTWLVFSLAHNLETLE